MWVGYNSKIFKDSTKIQKIEYLTQINNSPTDPAVIKETMRRSLAIASECGKKYFNVTYDLAIAKIALRIQAAEEEFNPSLFSLDHSTLCYPFLKLWENVLMDPD